MFYFCLLNGTFCWFCFIAYVRYTNLTLQEFILLSCTLLLFVSKELHHWLIKKKQFMFYFCFLNETFDCFITYVTQWPYIARISSVSLCTSEKDWKQYFWKKTWSVGRCCLVDVIYVSLPHSIFDQKCWYIFV